MLICTGAACARFVVNTPAATTGARSSVATIARSGAPDSLMPHASPAAHEPRSHGASIALTGMHSRASGRPVVSGRPSTRLAAWIAWPDAPFTRLSSAAIASTVSVRAS